MPRSGITFHFAEDVEGWVATPSSAPKTDMTWRKPSRLGGNHSSVHPPNDLAIKMGGCLRVTAKNGSTSNEAFWERAITWTDLSVPTGATVIDVTASYFYRWDMKNRKSNAAFGTNEAGVGPMEFRKNDTTLVGTFSPRIYAPARTAEGDGDNWTKYPISGVGVVDPAHVYPMGDPQNGWGLALGDTIAIPGPLQPLSTTVRFRINSLQPTLAARDHSNKYNNGIYLRLKIDRVKISVRYTLSGVRRTVV